MFFLFWVGVIILIIVFWIIVITILGLLVGENPTDWWKGFIQ